MLGSKGVLQRAISALRKIMAKYLSFLAGDLASPHVSRSALCW